MFAFFTFLAFPGHGEANRTSISHGAVWMDSILPDPRGSDRDRLGFLGLPFLTFVWVLYHGQHDGSLFSRSRTGMDQSG